MGNNVQQWATMGNNGQQWTIMYSNGQQSAVLHAFLMPFVRNNFAPNETLMFKNVKNTFLIILAQLTGPLILAQYALDDCEAFKP